MIVRVLILYGLVQLLVVTGKPLLCAVIYAVVGLLFGLMMGAGISGALFRTAMMFLLAFAYFWLLSRTNRGSGLWWLVLAGGCFVGMV